MMGATVVWAEITRGTIARVAVEIEMATKGAMAVSEVEAETEMKTQAMTEMETAKSEGDGSEDNNGGGGRQRWLRWLPRRRRH
jgi:hypothetical protein